MLGKAWIKEGVKTLGHFFLCVNHITTPQILGRIGTITAPGAKTKTRSKSPQKKTRQHRTRICTTAPSPLSAEHETSAMCHLSKQRNATFHNDRHYFFEKSTSKPPPRNINANLTQKTKFSAPNLHLSPSIFRARTYFPFPWNKYIYRRYVVYLRTPTTKPFNLSRPPQRATAVLCRRSQPPPAKSYGARLMKTFSARKAHAYARMNQI